MKKMKLYVQSYVHYYYYYYCLFFIIAGLRLCISKDSDIVELEGYSRSEYILDSLNMADREGLLYVVTITTVYYLLIKPAARLQ